MVRASIVNKPSLPVHEWLHLGANELLNMSSEVTTGEAVAAMARRTARLAVNLDAEAREATLARRGVAMIAMARLLNAAMTTTMRKSCYAIERFPAAAP